MYPENSVFAPLMEPQHASLPADTAAHFHPEAASQGQPLVFMTESKVLESAPAPHTDSTQPAAVEPVPSAPQPASVEAANEYPAQQVSNGVAPEPRGDRGRGGRGGQFRGAPREARGGRGPPRGGRGGPPSGRGSGDLGPRGSGEPFRGRGGRGGRGGGGRARGPPPGVPQPAYAAV